MDMTDDKKIYTDIDEAEEKALAAKSAKGEEKEKDDFVELLKAMVFAAVIALGIRTFLFEPFNIPSASMYPSLLIGDYLFVEKYAYGYSRYSFPLGLVRFDGRVMEDRPKTGDVIVFRKPTDTSVDYIKRLIGLPGDTVQMKEGRLYINDEMVKREWLGTEQRNDGYNNNLYQKYRETLPNGVEHIIYELSDNDNYDNTPKYVVPEGHYFMMGDNRDGSLDSRAQREVGFVPAENLVGRAAWIFYSTDGIGDKCDRDGVFGAMKSVGCKFIEWPKAVRYSRMFRRVRNL
jgi:signal peptidase I